MDVGEANGARLPSTGDGRVLEPTGLDPAVVPSIRVRTATHGDTNTAEVLERHSARGLVVLHRGRLAHEWYADGIDPARPNACFSITKSWTGTLAARAMHDGRLDRDSLVADLVPELAGGGFGDASVGDVADMTVGVDYDEEYDGATAHGHGFGDYLVAIGFEPPTDDQPTSIRSLLSAMGRSAVPHGHTFAYGTPVTDVLGWLLERADGRPYVEQLRTDLWAAIGAEHEADVLHDPAGTPLAGGGLMATTRDIARFGQLVLEQATAPTNGARPVIPAPVIDTIRDGGDRDAFQRGGQYAYLGDYSYRDQWWLPGGPSRPLSAWGIYGQVLWIDVEAGVVIACHAGGPDASDARRDLEQDAMCRAIVDAAAGW